MIERLKAAGIIVNGTHGPIIDAAAVDALLTRPLDVPRLSQAMSVAYKSVGSWDDFDDAVGTFAEAVAVEYVHIGKQPDDLTRAGA